jgi:Tfp pilus assembly protein PilP
MIFMTKKAFLVVYMLACVFFLPGCREQSRQQEIEAYVARLKLDAEEKVKVEANPVWQLPKPVIYQAGNGPADKNPDAANSSNPLLLYPIKSLQFVGTLTQNNMISAYIMTPDNMIYLVKVGDVIGDNYAKIVKIDSDHIEISEADDRTGNQSGTKIVTMELKD